MSSEGAPERILIVGGMGTGKTTLARRIAAASKVPLHHLDDLAYPEGTGSSASPYDLRQAAVRIAESPRWVAEGIHLGWTDPLLRAADVILWLDHVQWKQASGRVLRRFVSGAMAEARRQQGARRFLRLRDYARQLRELAVAIPATRRYEGHLDPTFSAGEEVSRPSRVATAARLAQYGDKVIRCRTHADVKAALRRIAPTA